MFSSLTRYASELDIPVQEAEMDIRASYDARGKILDDVSPGAQRVYYTLEIKSPASSAKISQLVQKIEKGCRTLNTVMQATPISARLIHNGTEIKSEV